MRSSDLGLVPMHKFHSPYRTECHSVLDGLANRPTWELTTEHLGSQQDVIYPADFGERLIARLAKPRHG
jgi:hypothetical protein